MTQITPQAGDVSEGGGEEAPRAVAHRGWRRSAAAVFVLIALAFVVPAVPGAGTILGGEELYYFRPPLSEIKPASVERPPTKLLADPVEVFHPDLEWMAEQVRSDELPLWNPHVGAGWPQLASQQTAPLFPLNLPAYVLPFWDSLGLIAALRLLLAAAGTFLFCRSALRLHPAAGILAAVAFAAGAYFVSWLEHPHGNVYAMLPWLLLTVDRVIRSARWSDGAGFGAVLGLAFLGGHPQSVLIDAFLVAPYALWRISPWATACLGPPGARLLRTALVLGSGTAIALAAGAVMLLPLFEFIGASLTQRRGGLGGIDPNALLSLMLPELWGRPASAFQGAGPLNFFERTVYVGAPALLLAIAGLAVRRCAAQWFFSVMAVVGTALAVTLPVVTWVADNVPPFSLVAMARALVLPSFALAVLGGFGLHRLIAADAAGWRRALIAGAVAGLLPAAWLLFVHSGSLGSLDDALGAVPAVPGEPEDQDAALAGSVLRWLSFALPALLLIALLRGRPRLVLPVVAGVLAVQVVDVVELGRGLHPVADRDVVDAGPTAVLARASADQGAGRTTGSEEYLLPNQGERFGLRDPRVRGQPTIGRVDSLYAAYAAALPRTFSVDWQRAGDVLDAFGVKQVLTGDRAADPAEPDLELVAASEDDRLYRNTSALPRAFVATSWRRPNSQDEALAMTVHSSTEELRTAPVVELPSGPPFVTRRPGGRARITLDGANRVSVDVHSPAPGRLVLLDAHYPGWTATVDGRSAAISPTNAAFRSVAVPAGASTVEFRYRPLSVYVGATVSAVTWLSLLVWLVVVRRRRGAAA